MKLTRQRDKIVYVAILLLSAILFIYFLKQNYNVNLYDEHNYLEISNTIRANGLFNSPSDLRTYLYPLLISVFSIFSDNKLEHIKIIFCVFQYAVFILCIIYIARSALVLSKKKFQALVILLIGACNPYLIQATTLFLTDILSACAIAVAFMRFVNKGLLTWRDSLIFFSLIFAAIMLRPSHAIFIVFLPLLLAFCWWKYRNITLKFVVIGSIGATIIFLPQLYLNIKYFNDWTPLIHLNLYKDQAVWATQYLKYGTLVAPGETPQLYYYPPFSTSEDTKSIYSMILNDLPKFLVLYTTHIFGVLSWGDVNTYVRSLRSETGFFGTIFLSLVWGLVTIGLIKEKNKKILVSLLSVSTGYLLFIGTTCVESRFGYPVYLLLLFFVGRGSDEFVSLLKRRGEKKWFKILLGLLFVVIFTSCSFWLENRTGRIKWF